MTVLKRLFAMAAALAVSATMFGCADEKAAEPVKETSAETAAEEPVKEEEKSVWIATWGSAMLRPTNEDEQIPSRPSLSGNTLRQQIRVSLGGKALRLVITNEFGDSDLVIETAAVSKLIDPKSYEIDTESTKALTYGGESSFSVPAGERITTDPLDFEFEPLSDLAISFKLGDAPATMRTLTCHTASRCSTWTVSGDHALDNDFDGCRTTTAWYYISELDTLADEGAGTIVCFGDSLTDGASVTTNGFSTYPQELARLVHADDELNNLAVINMGIGATALYIYGDDCGKKRLERDVLDAAGAKYCVMLYGVNDIGAAQSDISDALISEYKSVIEKCHEKGIKVYGCTVTPFKGNAYYSELHESIRKKVNEFILSEDSGYDGVIDLASAVASENDPEQLERKYVSVWNDFLHFNDGGYKYVAETVFGRLKEFIG